ncbi:MAG TPA: hypothetical protein P5014_02370 [Patescibacteria group bacterium]|nr:hypothetical protein [Patescibacteria group bacterium]
MIKAVLIQKVFAEVSFDDPDVYGGGIFQGAELDKVFEISANIVIWVGLGLVLVFLALGFIKFITSQGDKVATEQAQKWVTYSIIGGVGLLAVFAIRGIIMQIAGYKKE